MNKEMQNNIDIISNLLGPKLLYVDNSTDIITITVESNDILDILNKLYSDEQLAFRFLTDLCGIHYPNGEKSLGVIYHLHNMQTNTRIRVKAFVTQDYPHISTVTTLFKSANWMERETFDFYGIIFDSHPNLKRILNMDEMNYHPMLKQYPLEDATRDDKDDKYFGR